MNPYDLCEAFLSNIIILYDEQIFFLFFINSQIKSKLAFTIRLYKDYIMATQKVSGPIDFHNMDKNSWHSWKYLILCFEQ